MLAFDQVLVNFGTTVDIIGFHGEHLLQGVGRTISFKCPDLHLTKSLTTELRLTTQGLLGHQGIRPCRAGMHFVVHQMVKLQHMHKPNRDATIKGITGASIMKRDLCFGLIELQHLGMRIV